MEQNSWKKIVQKRVYDVISHRYGILTLLIGAILIVISAFHFGESVMEWSTEKYAAVFNSFSDNLAGRSFRGRLCLPVPIDVVYTWVNGTDPELIRSLKRLKLDMQDQLNISRVHLDKKGEATCVFRNCLPSTTVVLYPMLPVNMTLTQFGDIAPEFKVAKRKYLVTSPLDYKNYTAVEFAEEGQVLAVMNLTLRIDGQNTSIVRCHITPDSTVINSVRLDNQIIMSGFPHTLKEDELKSKLPDIIQKGVDKIEVNPDKGIAVLHVPVKEDFDKALQVSNFTIDGKQPELNAAHLVWDLRDFSRDEDISASRFEDNEELRYSLRSVERFAPWVRHIYLVTNGQLPNWLNLENPRLTIVTHEEIFKNKSHLPSFGSPAIESNIHNIPGLSDKFIYMNDDVMFGRDVWPDDFFTHSNGQKVYLTWPVPNCNEGCPSSWIKDGYCDKACNVSECEWDAGDCTGVSANQNQGGWAGMGAGWQADTSNYCHSGCANNWIADRYCDTACNVLQCGFDAGDCGTDNFDKLHSVTLLSNKTLYRLPNGVCMGYFNLTTILAEKNATLKNAFYDDNKAIRTIAIAKKFKVMSVILHCNTNKTQINFTIQFDTNSTSLKELNFTLESDSRPAKVKTASFVSVNETSVRLGVNGTKSDNSSKIKREVIEEEVVKFDEIPTELQGPHVIMPPPAPPDVSSLMKSYPVNMSEVPLPGHLKDLYKNLQEELKIGEITETGYQIRLQSLWVSYQQYLLSNQSQIDTHREQNPGNHPDLLVNDQQPVKRIPRKRLSRLKPETGNQGRRRLLNIHEVEMAVEEGEEKVEGKFDSFVQNVDIQPELGKLLPWERGTFNEILKAKEVQETKETYEISVHRGRHTLDTFGDSLRHVNNLYNKAFGYTARKVPGHMPHMIDKNIMMELQARFPEEWDATSSHQVRHPKDMQYAFSYFYYLMGVKENTTAAHVFDEMDTDKSRVLSDREIRTLATRLYDLPLDLPTLTKLEFTFVNCSKNLTRSQMYQPDAAAEESYYESEMPQVTRNLFINCPAVQTLVKSNFPPKSKYQHSISDDAEISFKMIKTNVSSVVGQLDDVRKNPKKFICLNDNIDHTQDQAKTVKAILQDFYESFFPIPSQFELPREYRNRFTHIDELREWQRYRYWLKFWTHIALALLVIFTVASYFGDKIEAAQKRFARRRAVPHQSSDRGKLETV